MKKLLNKPWFYALYCIPQFIMIHSASTASQDFKNVNACISDYYLFFYNWFNYFFLCMYEIIFISFFMVLLIRKEMDCNRVILYDSTLKLWKNCIKSSVSLTFIVPIINNIIIGLVAILKHASVSCNWNEIGSFAKNMMPYFDIKECNLWIIIILCMFLDILRLQVALLMICIIHWLFRKSIIDFFIVYINVILVNLQGLFGYYNMNIKCVYKYMIMSQRRVYLYGISIKDNIVVPVFIWSCFFVVSILAFRFYRKDMLNNQ